MVALDLDHAFLERAACTAATFECARQVLQLSFGKWHTCNSRDRLATPPFAFPANTSDTVAFGYRGRLANTGIQRLTATWAVAPRVGGKHQTAKAGKGRGFLGHTQPLEHRNRRDKTQRHKAVQFNSKTSALEGLRSALLQTPPNSTTAPHGVMNAAFRLLKNPPLCFLSVGYSYVTTVLCEVQPAQNADAPQKGVDVGHDGPTKRRARQSNPISAGLVINAQCTPDPWQDQNQSRPAGAYGPGSMQGNRSSIRSVNSSHEAGANTSPFRKCPQLSQSPSRPGTGPI